METASKSAFQFTNPLLMEMNFSVNQEYLPPEGNMQEIPVEIKVSRPDLEACEDRVAPVFLTIHIGEKGNREFPYFLCATMGANFRWEPFLSAEMVGAMLAQNAPSLLLGYLRPYIAQITAASPAGAFHIPFMNFVPQDAQQEDKEEPVVK